MPAGIWTDVIDTWMGEIAVLGLYAGLFAATPFGTDPTTVEVIGTGYVRHAISHERVGVNLIRNTAAITWLNLPVGTHIWGLGVWDAAVGGQLKAVCQLLDPTTGAAAPVDLPAGGTWSLDTHELQFGIDVAVGP